MTQTHVLLGAGLFARRGTGTVTAAAIAGALLPDADLWLMTIVEFAAGSSGCEIFHYRYWQAPWTLVQAVGNSAPLYGLVMLTGLAMAGFAGSDEKRPGSARRIGILAAVFAASALLHVGADFMLHHDDARRHFWPLSDWVFRSPVSYWDPAHHGDIFVLFETVLGVGLAALLWRRFDSRKAHILLVLGCLGYGLTIYASILGAAAHDKGPGSCENHPIRYEHGRG